LKLMAHAKAILMTLMLVGLAPGATRGSSHWSLSLAYKASYDNNILRYSERDYQRAREGTEKYVSPVSTLDDVRSDLKASLSYRFQAVGKLDSRFTAAGDFAQYSFNPINNFGWVSLTYRQQVASKWDALVHQFYEPYYFLRDYRDRHTGGNHHCDFAMSKTIGKVYYSPNKALEFDAFGEYKRYAYNKYFTEFDGNRIGIGGEGVFRTGPWRLSAAYSLGMFNNIGFDSADRIPAEFQDSEDNENGDGSYEEDGYEFSCQYSTKLQGRRVRAKTQLNLDDRYYTSDLPMELDLIHRGRHDVMLTAEVSVEYSLSVKTSLSLGGTWYNRDSEADSPLVSELKDYQRALGWIEITYNVR